MNADGIFFVDDGDLVPMIVTPYESEDLLQRLLVEFPAVLAGTVTADDDRRSLLLVQRERAIPVAKDATGRFSIDHFFVDSAGVPVLVEVKRSSDTRIRREVVGQMLDYAANAVRHWPIDEIRADFEVTHADTDANGLLAEFADVGDPEEFWTIVDRNVREGRVRMLFVADAFPDELVRVIEFLNEQMTPAEVLGVEVRQFVDAESGRRALVPRTIGATAAAERVKRSPKRREPWNRDTMIAEATSNTELLGRVLDAAESASISLSWGSGQKPRLSVWRVVGGESRPTWNVGVRASGEPYLGVWRSDLMSRPGVDAVQPFFDELTAMVQFAAAFDRSGSFPEVPLGDLGSDDVERFLEIVETHTSVD